MNKRSQDVSYKELQNDLDKCALDADDIEVAWGLLVKNKSKVIKKLNTKKKKNITNKLSKNTTNEIFWQNKNEIKIARKVAGFNVINIRVKTCLSCYNNFESEGKHNRVCDDCRKENGF